MTTATKQDGALAWADTAPDYVSGVASLYSWSANYVNATPFKVFLNLIGWSADQFGESLPVDESELGYHEIGLLAEALTEYANRPSDVMTWVSDLMTVEMEYGA